MRIPGALGNAIGIVGGLIIGQAAVEANLVSPVVVIIVALTALGSLAIPNEEFASAFRLLKYAFLFLGGFLGIFGIVLGLYLTMAHLAGLLSFGVPYLVPFVEKNSEAETGGRISPKEELLSTFTANRFSFPTSQISVISTPKAVYAPK